MKERRIQDAFLKALENSFENYNKDGARSNKKLIPIHKWLADYVKDNMGEGFEVQSLGTGKETSLEGKYYKKNLDIAVLSKARVISTISFKFVTSNYKQNSNNYFENLLGETANIRTVNVGFAHLLVLRAKTPYYDKNKGNLRGKTVKEEKLNEHDLMKYIKLFKDNNYPHKPDVLGIAIIDINNSRITLTKLDELGLNSETIRLLEEELSIYKFLTKFIALCTIKA